MTQEVEQTKTVLVLVAELPEKLSLNSISIVRMTINNATLTCNIQTHRLIIAMYEVFSSSKLCPHFGQFLFRDSVKEARNDLVSLTNRNLKVLSKVAVIA